MVKEIWEMISSADHELPNATGSPVPLSHIERGALSILHDYWFSQHYDKPAAGAFRGLTTLKPGHCIWLWTLERFLILLVHSFIMWVFRVYVEPVGKMMPWSSQCDFLSRQALGRQDPTPRYSRKTSENIYEIVPVKVIPCNAYTG